MSHRIRVRNVNEAYRAATWWMRTAGVVEQSRNGPVLVAPGTFQTEYDYPIERVLFNRQRDANHVFHLMEAIWMLAGRNDVEWLQQFNSRYVDYADRDGKVWGAYGARWRTWLGLDQLHHVVDVLTRDPHSRQAVLQMWDAPSDLGTTHADRPCNTHIYFDTRGNELNMTVCCRSNDMLWGAYGANVVHFSILQEVLAAALKMRMGVYRQFSNNFHLYTNVPQVQQLMQYPPFEDFDLYLTGEATPYFFVAPGETLHDILDDCTRLVEGDPVSTEFMCRVAKPLHDAYLDRKRGNPYTLDDIAECDWKEGFKIWLSNRKVTA